MAGETVSVKSGGVRKKKNYLSAKKNFPGNHLMRLDNSRTGKRTLEVLRLRPEHLKLSGAQESPGNPVQMQSFGGGAWNSALLASLAVGLGLTLGLAGISILQRRKPRL